MFTLFVRSDVMEGGGGGNIRKFERVGIDRTSGNYERRNGKGDEGTTTSNSVRATKEENSCNKRSWTRANYFYSSGSPFDPGDTEEIMPPVTVS